MRRSLAFIRKFMPRELGVLCFNGVCIGGRILPEDLHEITITNDDYMRQYYDRMGGRTLPDAISDVTYWFSQRQTAP